MTIKTHGRMFTDNTVGIPQLAISDGTSGQAIVTDGSGTIYFATVGAGGSVGSSVYVEDIRTGDGSTVTFSLSTAAPYEESILVFIDGVAQPTSSFTLPSTTSITFTPAPGNGAAIRICHLGIASSLADCAVTGAKICMGGDTAGDILYYNGSTYQRLGIGTALQIFRTNAAVNAPEWVDATTASLPAVGASGNVLTSDASNWSSQPPLGGVGGELVSTQSFSASGTWTRPSGVKRIEVHLIGAGGNTTAGSGWGGGPTGGAGGGGYCLGIYDVTDLASATVTIGTPTTVSTFVGSGITTLTANFGTSLNDLTTGGAGGAATGGSFNLAGSVGDTRVSTTEAGGDGGRAAGPFGGNYGRGAEAVTAGNSRTGDNGYCLVKEYSDVSASLVGEKLVSHEFLEAASNDQGPHTWTKPANITKIRVYVQGAGGGSNGFDGVAAAPAGGGGCAIKIIDVRNVTSYTYSVGHCVLPSNNLIHVAGNSIWDASGLNLVGGGGSSVLSSGTAGIGGTATGGDINMPGAAGGVAGNSSNRGSPGGPFSSRGSGSGGAAADTNFAGTAGYIYIEEYTDPSLSVLGAGIVGEEVFTTHLTVPTNSGNEDVRGVWTKPLGVKSIEVTCIGGGANGGSGTHETLTGGHGGAGGVGKQMLDVRTIDTLPYKVGLGGGAQAISPAHVNGGDSVFGADNDSGTSIAATATVTSGAIASIAVTNGGTGFTVAPLISIQSNVQLKQGGKGATATATINGSGVLTAITVTNGGSGYIQGEVDVFFGLCGGATGASGTNSSGSGAGTDGVDGVGYGNTNSMQYTNVTSGYGAGRPGITNPAGSNNLGFATVGAIIVKSYK